MIDRVHLNKVCKIGQGKDCCRYMIAYDAGINCAKQKGQEECKQMIDNRKDKIVAQADNCDGWTDE